MPIMKLTEYLKLIGKRPGTFAKEHNLSRSTIWRAVKGKGFPDPATIKSIQEVTSGAVKPDDWYN